MRLKTTEASEDGERGCCRARSWSHHWLGMLFLRDSHCMVCSKPKDDLSYELLMCYDEGG